MNESLTQKDVDALVAGRAPETSAVQVAEVTPYSFVRPPHVSKERRATLEAVYSRFALGMQALLSSRLRTHVDVAVGSVEQTTFSEFVLSLGQPCSAFVFKVGDQLGGEGVIDLGNDLAYLLVDRLFGGPGDSGNPARPLTSIEQTVVRSVAERSLVLLRDAWQNQLQTTPEVISFESNPDMLRITKREDNVLVANLAVRSGSFSGYVTLCLPSPTVEPLLREKASSRALSARSAAIDSATHRPVVESGLRHAHLTLTARLPTVWLSARTIADLKPGQVIHTGQSTDVSVGVQVNGRPRFQGSLGQIRRRVGLRITQTISAPVDERPGRIREGRVS